MVAAFILVRQVVLSSSAHLRLMAARVV